MNTKRSVRWSLLAGAAVSALLAATPGCELLVDFDRSKIPADASIGDDGAVTDGSVSPFDGSLPDAGDAAADAGVGADATVPVTDAASDAAVVDASVPPDTGVAPVDASIDAPLDVAVIPDTGAAVDEASVPDAADQ